MNNEAYNISRRAFVAKMAATGALMPFTHVLWGKASNADARALPPIHIFSKQLQFLDYKRMAEAAADMGFDGVDLTVRPGGHVLPENVKRDLPKAIKAIRDAGLSADMITTKVDDATDPVDGNVLEVAANEGVKYYRMNWVKYLEDKRIPASISHYQQRFKDLGMLNKQLGLVGCYQNHAGRSMGASIWELYDMIKLADDGHMGVQYDIRHATVEGGLSWENGLKLIRPHIKTIVLKDFKWGMIDGKWKVIDVPVGEGMVDFTKYFRMLKDNNIVVPVSLHLEYPIGGAEHGARNLDVDKQVVFEAMKKDLNTIKALWEKA